MNRACLGLLAVLACLLPCAQAQAGQSLTLNASLRPNLLDRQTTIGFDFTITASHGRVPSPLTSVALRYPGDVGIVVSGLGLDACMPETLRLLGPAGCPSDALMGMGSATVEIPVGHAVVRESATVAIERAPTKDERFALTFYTQGASPIVAQLALPALLLDAHRPFGGSVAIEPPLIPSLPEAPDVSVVRLHAAIGPEHLTYYRREHGTSVAYRPRGVRLPKSCPRGGWPFTAVVGFLDGSHARARASVPCPGSHS
ncbi:MAG: hypothetical protein ACYDHN_09600 [Solirubrobacteraceae bacterium]